MASKVAKLRLLSQAALQRPAFRQYSGPVNPVVTTRQVEIINLSEPPEKEGPGNANQWMVFSLVASAVVNGLVAYNAFRHEEEPILWINYPHLRKAKKPMPFGNGEHNLMHNTHCRLEYDDYMEWKEQHQSKGKH